MDDICGIIGNLTLSSLNCIAEFKLLMEDFGFYANMTISGLLGGFLALSELLSRYRKLGSILGSSSAWMYMTINIFASFICYYLATEYQDKVDFFSNPLIRVLLSGLSAMVILRSSFYSYHDKDSNKTINIGLAAILQTFLDVSERSFDQEQSVSTIKKVTLIMKDIDFNRASLELTTTCLNLMHNVSSEEQKRLSDSIKTLAESTNFSNEAKSVNLGIILSKITGAELLEQAVKSHRGGLAVREEDNKKVFSELELLKAKISRDGSK